MREQRHSAFGDKSGNLRSDFQSLTSSKLLQSSLDNPLFSSKILECQEGKPSAECKENTESKKNLDSRFSNSDSESRGNIESSFNFLDSKSKQYTESPTPKNLIKALPDSNNGACGSASRAKLQNCAIFAQQKSNQINSACRMHPVVSVVGVGGEVESFYPPTQIGSDLARVAEPLAHTCTF